MSIRYIGKTIKEARIQSGLTQEQFSEGVCDVTTLARIESGRAGAGPALFQALMTKAGKTSQIFPVFMDRKDFDCFFLLKEIKYNLQAFQTDDAGSKLETVRKLQWCDNILYYQEWLLLLGRTLKYSGYGDGEKLLELFEYAINLTRTDISYITIFKGGFFTVNEVALFLEIAEQLCLLHRTDESSVIISYFRQYLEKPEIGFDEREEFMMSIRCIHIMQLIVEGHYEDALNLVEEVKTEAAVMAHDTALIELHILAAVCYFRLRRMEEYDREIKTAFYSSMALKSGFEKVWAIILEKAKIKLPEALHMEATKKVTSYEDWDYMKHPEFRQGVLGSSFEEVFGIGKIISALRKEQHLTLQELAMGVCSKSCLSKIESGSLNPDIMLAETLLQRLGLSTDCLIFYGTRHETDLYNLRRRIVLANRNDKRMESILVEQLGSMLCSKDKLMRQYYKYKKAMGGPDGQGKLDALMESLQMTIQDFDIENLGKIHMSWTELTIVNNICNIKGKLSPLKTQRIWEKKYVGYLQNAHYMSALLKRRVYSLAVSHYSSFCFKEEAYEELVQLHRTLPKDAFWTTLVFMSYYLANLCQAYGILHMYDEAEEYATQSYYLFLLYGNKNAAARLKEFMLDDNGIVIG